MIWLWVGLGAAVGAPARYLIDRLVQGRFPSVFPWGTLLVNLVGSFVLGIVTATTYALTPSLEAALGAGFCGALTTYSTFSYETLRLFETGAGTQAAANVTIALAGGMVAAALGLAAGGWLV